MSGRGRDKTGGNMEPMPFIRKFGAAAALTAVSGETSPEPMKPLADNGNGFSMAKSSPFSVRSPPPRSISPAQPRSSHRRKHRRSSHSRERSSKRRSRSRESKRRRSRSGSRHRRRSRSRSRSRRSRSRRDSRSRSRSRERRRRQRDRTTSPPKDPSTTEVEESPAVDIAVALAKLKQAQAINSVQPLLARTDLGGNGTPGADGSPGENTEKRTRKSRWSTNKSFVPGMPTILPSNLSDDQRQAYLLQLEVEDATRKLRLGDFLGNPNPALRSPSPEPVYDASGKRLNTREIRKRQELEQLRHEKIQGLLKLNPMFKPPADYRAPMIRLHDKVWIPQDNHPEINFVGLLIGPRGNTLKSLEADTGAKIIIRGKGSVKEGKLGRREGPMPGENEPLHAYVTGTDTAVIKKACEKIKDILNEALMIPDGQNELRKLQLRELALLNGTLRPEDLASGMRCSNCGSDEHKTWECPEDRNVTASIICTSCGGAGHIAKDCLNQRPGAGFAFGNADGGMDDEYSALMEELGETPPAQPGGGFPGQESFGRGRGRGRGAAFGADTDPISHFGIPTGYKSRYTLPSGTPIVRINLMNPQGNYDEPGSGQENYSGSGVATQLPTESGHFFNQPAPVSRRSGQWSGGVTAVAPVPAPTRAGNNTWGGGAVPPPSNRYPMPVPPPPPPMALGLMPPPPPPPAPTHKMDLSSLLAPPAPPPPPPV